MRNNTYGFEVDGPVWIPKLFDGRNKAFFMLSLETLKERTTSGNVRTVATAEERAGDFSKLMSGGTQIAIHDPLTTRLEGDKYVRTPFAGNVIPGGRISPIARRWRAAFRCRTGRARGRPPGQLRQLQPGQEWLQQLAGADGSEADAEPRGVVQTTARRRGRTGRRWCGGPTRRSRAGNGRRRGCRGTGARIGHGRCRRRWC